MADLFLHLPFARRLRFADGLHPLAGEAIGRRPALVALGAALACLPENERRGMSWFRRLFSGGSEAARWQKLLAATPGNPHLEVILNLLLPDEAALGPIGRLALGIGVVSHEILEEKIGALSAQQGPQRAAIERAQARLWLQSAVPRNLEGEWKPALELADPDANKKSLAHVDRALKRVHGAGPGEAALGRWLKGLAVELTPLAEGKGQSGALPPPLSISDHEARGPHFESVGFVEKTQAAVAWTVGVANRLGEAFSKGNPDRATLLEALAKLAEPKPNDVDSARTRWKDWLHVKQDEALTRGRNPKPAFAEGEAGYVPPQHSEQRLASITKVMNLADLPPEALDPNSTGAPPMPEGSGPVQARRSPPPPPMATQEVSLAQIEAESKAFQAPALTQEVSVAQIAAEEFQTPAHTQEVSTTQLVEDPAKITQPISVAEIAAANAADGAGNVIPPAPASTEPPRSADDAVAATSTNVHAETAPAAEPSGPTAAAAPDPPADAAPIAAADAGAAPGAEQPHAPVDSVDPNAPTDPSIHAAPTATHPAPSAEEVEAARLAEIERLEKLAKLEKNGSNGHAEASDVTAPSPAAPRSSDEPPPE